MTALRSRHLLGLRELDRAEIEAILDSARGMKGVFAPAEGPRNVKKVPALQGRTVVNCFFEPSTRTRQSFDLAAKRLSADVVTFQESGSSAVKGESLLDTVRTLEALASDIVVVRHKCSGVPHLLARKVRSAIVNAGDGAHEHPTQGLLDLLTVRERKGGVDGLRVVIVGDIRHSRVARSDIWGFTKMGARITVVGPPPLIPAGIEVMGVEVETDFDRALKGADVVIMLRIQTERMESAFFPSIREYHRRYGMTPRRLELARPDCVVMHPGPLNRGIEIDGEVADGPQSAILDQVTNGVAVRMAVLYLLAGRL